MSMTYDIVCRDCKKKLWVGQNHYIYYGIPERMIDLSDFLFTHKGHRLGFEDENFFDLLPDDERELYENVAITEKVKESEQ